MPGMVFVISACVAVLLGIKPKALLMLGKNCTVELHPWLSLLLKSSWHLFIHKHTSSALQVELIFKAPALLPIYCRAELRHSLLVLFLWFFYTGFLCVALTVLDLTL